VSLQAVEQSLECPGIHEDQGGVRRRAQVVIRSSGVKVFRGGDKASPPLARRRPLLQSHLP
jgi:hypothetical protein